MIPNVGPLEIVVVLIVALVVFGPKRLPELGSSLGKGIRDFGKGIKGEDEPAVLEQRVASDAHETPAAAGPSES
jgi:TatA/E family protein of Tat protein translocase